MLARADWDGARKLLDQAQAASPRGTAWLQIGLGWLELGEHDACHQALAAAEGDLPGNPAVHLFRSLLRCDQGDWQAARRDWWTARNLSPANQALPTARAVRYLGENRVAEALDILRVKKKPHSFDVAVSAPVVGRLAVALERKLLPLELPVSLETEPPTEEPPPQGSANALSARGQKRIGKVLRPGTDEEPDPAELRLAVAELRAAREKNPKAFRASYHLGEALLFAAEYDRDREAPLGPQGLARVLEAEGFFEESRTNDSQNAYVLHFLAQCALLRRNFVQAAALWRKALEGFEKFPEAHYGLGKALLAQGLDREARHHILQSVLSDLYLLRWRLRDLDRLHRLRPEAFATPAEFPLWAAPEEAAAAPAQAAPADVPPGTEAAETAPAAPEDAP